jgi:phosphatidate cytidylyltransferase
MGFLRNLTISQQIGLLFVVLFGMLLVVTAIAFSRTLRDRSDVEMAAHERFKRDLRAVWIGAVLFWVAWIAGGVVSTLLFGLMSFLALREFVTLTHTRRGDHRSLLLAFFAVLPLQYVIVAGEQFNLFTVFIPVYVFLAIPVVSALGNDPQRFLERTAKIQWGIMVCVYGMSHAPALLLLDLPDYQDRGAFLVLYLVVVVAIAQIVQEAASRRLRRRPVARAISRSFSWRAWGIGAVAAVLVHTVQEPVGRDRDGPDRRRQRHARRVRDARAEARCRCEVLGRQGLRDGRGRIARSRRTAVLRRAGVLPFGALVFRTLD